MGEKTKMKWNKLYQYPKSMRSLINNARHYDVGEEEKLPSVTTVLAATQSSEKRASLAKWRQKVGEIEAERVKNTAAARGTAMHNYLEHHVEGQGLLDLTDLGVQAKRMAETIIDKGFPELEEIYGSEVTLYYPGLYAGATDLCGVYMGRESIIDFKQTNKPKKKDWVEDYYLQLVAYAEAHNEVYGTKIREGHIFMCSRDLNYQQFDLEPSHYEYWLNKWLARVEQFYKL